MKPLLSPYRQRDLPRRLLSLFVVISLLAASLVTGFASQAAAVSAFAPVFSTNAPGDITFVSNTLMTCNSVSGTNAATCVSSGQNGSGANNSQTMREVDVDSDASTTNSSSNELTLASTSNVLYAGLFWVGMASSANDFDPNIKIDTPATNGYTDLVASNIDNFSTRHYGAYVDVTSLVQAGGSGTYTVGGADLLSGTSSRYGGWTLAIAYEDNNEPWRNLTVFNGYDFVYNGNSPVAYNVPLTVSGFTAPPVGPVNATIGVQTGEGDAAYSGPSTEVNGTEIFDAMNPINNTQNSTISILGIAANTLANPSYPNQLGFDADIMDATGLIPPNATSADLEFTSTGDVYGINLISTAIEIYVPNLTSSLSKVGTDLNGEQTHPGDIIEYRVKFDNTGDDPATNVVITDLVPTGTSYVPNSLQIIQDTGATGSMTDAAGDDQAFFDAGANSATFHVGTGANATQGGQVDPLSQGGQTHEVAFQVVVDNGTESTTVSNEAKVDYIAEFLNEPYSATTNPAEHDILPLVDLTITKSDDADPVTAGNDVTYTVVVENAGPSQADNVVITDSLPPGVTFTSGTGCSLSGTTLTCAGGSIAAGGNYSVDITVTVDGSFIGTSVTNLAEVTSDTHEHNTADNATSEATAVVRSTDIKLTKAAPATVSAGNDITYTLTVENLGDSDGLNVELFDPLPTGLGFVSSTADLGGICDATVTCNWSTLAAGASSTVTVVVSVPGSTADGSLITNKAKASSSDPDPDESNNTSAVVTEVDKLADLSTTKTGPSTAVAGSQVTYTLGVTNDGPSEAVNVTLSDPIPATGLTLNSAASSPGCSLSSGVVACAAGTMASGTTATFTLVFEVDSSMAAGTIVTNTATASSETDDPDSSNDSASVDTEIVREADLSIVKDDNALLAVAGTQLTYTLIYANDGSSDASGVNIVDTLPSGVAFNVGLSDSSCSAAAATVTCSIGNVAASTSGSIDVVVDISSSVADGATLTNSAVISGIEDDPNGANDASKVDTPVKRTTELEIAKTDNVDPVVAGEDVSYTITVTNLGPSTDNNIAVTDSLPSGVTFVSAPGCVEANGAVTCDIGTLAPLATASFVVTVTADADLSDGQVITNTASVAGSVSGPATVSEQTTVQTEADLGVTKTAPAAATAGESVVYSIIVTNSGPSDAANVSLTDALPTGTTYASHSVVSGAGTCTATTSNVSCSQATLAPGASFAVDIVVDVSETVADGAVLSNTVLVSSDTADPDPDNNDASAPTTIARLADLVVTKTAIDPSVPAGQQASFQIIVSNSGPSQATGVTVTDTLPSGFSFDAVNSSPTCASGVTCTVPTALNTGDAYTFTVVADVSSAVTDATYTNSVSVSGNETDLSLENNADSAEVAVITEANLSISKSSDDLTFTPGTTQTYTIVVANGGPSDAQDVVVTDVLPTGLTFNAAASSTQCLAGVSCVVPTLPAGQSVTLTIAVDIDSSLTSEITNTAAVTSTTNDPDTSNNTDDDRIPVVPEANLAVTKSAADTITAGNNLVYTLTLTNQGPSFAHNVAITDVLPAGVTFISASPACTEAAGTVSCTETSVADGATLTYTITVAVPASMVDGVTLTNEVDVTTDSFDPDTSDNGDEIETEVIRSANLTLDKAVSASTVEAGTSLTYTITATNSGPSNAANVVVTDTLPTGMTVTSVTTDIGSCFSTAAGISCSHPDLSPNATMTVVLVAEVDPSVADGTVLTNDATSSTTTTETNSADNTKAVDVTVIASADLGIVKEASTDSVVAGETLTYTITATNSGPSDAQDVVVYDTLASELTITSISPAADCSAVGNVVTCAAGAVANGSDYVVTIAVIVSEDAADDSTIANTASVASDTTDSNPDNNSATNETAVEKVADLGVSKVSSVGTIAAGQTLLYNIEVSNFGPSSATNVVVTDTLAPGVDFNSAMSNSNCVDVAGTITCTFPSIANAATVAFVIAVDLPADYLDGSTLTNLASAQADEGDPNAGNDSDTDEITASNLADLSIVKNAEGFVVAGESIVWTIDVKNGGPSDAVNVVVTDALPAGATFNAAGSDSRCAASALLVTCTITSMPTTATDSLLIEVDVDSSVADFATLTNEVSIESETVDPNVDDNTSSDDVPVSRTSDLGIVKTDVADPVTAGGQAQWAITVVNNGPSDANNVTIVDTLPTGFSLVSVDDTTNCTALVNTVNCSFPIVTAGSSVSILITADVSSNLVDGSTHTNTATTSSDSSDPVSDSENTAVQRRADLQIIKTSDGTVVAGTNQTYTISVTNDGLSDADNVIVTDTLPAGITFISDSLGACTNIGAVVTCDLGTMADQSTRSLELTAVVSDAATTPTINAVTVASDSTDPNLDDNTASDSTDITYEADLSLVKSAAPSPATPGEELTWTLVATNNGPSVANNVVITDVLPTGVTFESASVGCTEATGVVSCATGSIASEASTSFTITGILASMLIGDVTNTASLSSDTPDPDPTNNTATDATPLSPAADLEIVKDSNPDSVVAGETLTYTITVTNFGPSDAASVTVSDVVPAGLTVLELALSEDCTVVGQVVSCSTASLAANTDYVVTIVADLDENTLEGATISNTASTSSDTEDPNPDNNITTEETTVEKSADLSVVKEVTVNEIAAGQQLVYGLTVLNDGSSSATNVVVTDTLPAGVIYNEALSSSSCVNLAGVVTCSVPLLGASAVAVFNIVVDLPSSLTDGSAIENKATVSADEDDPDGSNNEDLHQIALDNVADLSVVKDVDGFAVAGEPISWNLSASNTGYSDAINVVITDVLPPGTTFDPNTSDERCSAVENVVTCSLGTLNANSTDGAVISVAVDSSLAELSAIENTATITSDTTDPDLEDNSSTDSVPVQRDSGISIVKSDLADPVVAGGQAQWSIQVSNAGPSDADNVMITDIAPPGFTLVSVDDNVHCTIADNSLSCTYPVVPSGQDISVVLSANVNSDLEDGSGHSNTATVSSDSSDSVSDTEDTKAVRYSNLAITKTSDNAVVAGTTQQYEITVVNEGPSDAANVIVTDLLPTGVTYISDTLNEALTGTSCSPILGTVTCELGTVADQQAITFTLVVAVDDAAGDLVVNSVTVDSDSEDPTQEDNISNDTTSVNFGADLQLTKTASSDPVVPGEPIAWTLTVANNGPSTATNVVVVDTLPAGTTFASASVGCARNGQTVTCSNSTLAAGAATTFEIVADIDSGYIGQISNSAAASSDTPDSNSGDNEATSTTATATDADLSVAKSVLTNPVVAGQNATFELTVTNAGPSDATNVTVTDALPPGLSFVWADSGCSLTGDSSTTSTDTSVECFIPTLANGASATFQLETAVDSSIPEGQVVTNTASVDSDTPDSDQSANESSIELPVTQVAELEVTKRVATEDPKVRERIEWIVEVTNVGPSSATNLSLSDTIGDAFSDVEVDEEGCTVDGNDVVCSRSELATATTWVVKISATADNDAAGDQVNVAQVESDKTELVSGSAIFNVRVRDLDLSIIKTSSSVVSAIGDTVDWSIVVQNSGDATAAVATIVDDVPPSQEIVSVTSDDATCSTNKSTIECTIAAGFSGRAEIAVTTKVLDVSGEIKNSASLAVVNGLNLKTERSEGTAKILLPDLPTGPLAFTGNESVASALLATTLLFTGFVLLSTSRRRRLRCSSTPPPTS